jgi:hypothetical protein
MMFRVHIAVELLCEPIHVWSVMSADFRLMECRAVGLELDSVELSQMYVGSGRLLTCDVVDFVGGSDETEECVRRGAGR